MLAQEWLNKQNRLPSEYDLYLESRLEIPKKLSGGEILSNIAERIVFTDDVPSLLYELYENKQVSFEGILSTTNLPYDCFWIEYKSRLGMTGTEFKSGSFGALVQKFDGDKVGMIIVTGLELINERLKKTCAVSHVIHFDQWPPLAKFGDDKYGIEFSVDYSYHGYSKTELGSVVCEIIFGIFLVTHPKIYTAEKVNYDEKLKRAYIKRNRPPPLEYRRIKLHIGKGRKVYPDRRQSSLDTESDAAIQHRRYHKVIGHFRHYLKRNPPHTVWIESHYRGDPEIGVMFTELDVMK